MVLNFLCNRKKVSEEVKENHGVVSIAGHKEKESSWINQDSFVVEVVNGSSSGSNIEQEQKPTTIIGVFDGHGPSGHLISAHCSKAIVSKLESNNRCAKKALEQLQEELEGEDFTSASGTTCALILLLEGRVEAYNIGDSQAFLGYRDGDHGKLKHILLTSDHSPSSDTEAERIKNAGGGVYKKSDEEPLRVWYKCSKTKKTVGLAMTRSLGDCSAHKVGVSCEPNELRRPITKDDEFIVVCSDGVTDVIDPEEVTIMIDHYMSSLPPDEYKYDWDPQEAANIVVSKARKRWADRKNIDDVTCCVIKLRDDENHFYLE